MLYAVYLLVSKNGKKYCQSKGFKTHKFSYSYLIFELFFLVPFHFTYNNLLGKIKITLP